MNYNDESYESSLSESLVTQSYLLVSGPPGDGSLARTRAAFDKKGLAPLMIDFDRVGESAEIRKFFEQAWTDRSPVVACGVERLESNCMREVVSCMEATAARGLAAALVTKGDLQGMDFGKAFLLVDRPLPDPVRISSALANRRESIQGMPTRKRCSEGP